MTHTFAILEVSAAAYDEIAAKLHEAGYQHAFISGAEAQQIDMHGIGLQAEPAKPRTEMLRGFAAFPCLEDDDNVSCEFCSKAGPIENMVASGDCYICQTCFGEWEAESNKCAHVLEVYDFEGEDGQVCTKCSRFFHAENEQPTPDIPAGQTDAPRPDDQRSPDESYFAWAFRRFVRNLFRFGSRGDGQW